MQSLLRSRLSHETSCGFTTRPTACFLTFDALALLLPFSLVLIIRGPVCSRVTFPTPLLFVNTHPIRRPRGAVASLVSDLFLQSRSPGPLDK